VEALRIAHGELRTDERRILVVVIAGPEQRGAETATTLRESQATAHFQVVDALVAEFARRQRRVAESRVEAAELAAARPGRVQHAVVADVIAGSEAPGHVVARAPDRAVDRLAGRRHVRR